LEESLGLRLFDRSTRHVELTVEGREFEISARRVLAEFEAALAGVHDQAARRRGRVSIALLPSLAAGWLPQVLAGFRTEFPGIEMQVADVLSEACIERCATGRPTLRWRPHGSRHRSCAPTCSAVTTSLCVGQITRLPRWPTCDRRTSPRSHSSTCHARQGVRQYLDAVTHPLQLQAVMEVDQLATVMGMVRAGLGISIVPWLTLFHFQSPGIVTRPLTWAGLTRHIYLVRRRDRSLSVAAQGFYEWVMARRPESADAPARTRRRTKRAPVAAGRCRTAGDGAG